jgi:hypothetical protein
MRSLAGRRNTKPSDPRGEAVTPFRVICLVFVLLLAGYVALYLHLSRRGDAWCRPQGFHGFLYVLPGDREKWYEWHQFCRLVFGPATRLDRALGGELYPVSNICFGLSK